MKRGIVIISGYNERAVIAFLRTLNASGIDDYAIIARDDKDQIFQTDYSDHVFAVRKNSDLSVALFAEYADGLRRKKHWDSFLIAPSTEGLNRFILDERGELEKLGYIIPLVDKGLYVSISDKKSFSELCKEQGLLIPEEIALVKEFGRQFVAKPVSYRYPADGSVYTPVLVRDRAEYDNFVNEYPAGAFYYQEYLNGGDSIYLLYYFSSGGTVYSLTQRNLAQLDNGGSMFLSSLSDEGLPIADVFTRLLSGLGFTGFIMIEVRIINDKCYVIEANPRFWGPAQLFVDAGYNLFDAFLTDYGFQNNNPEKIKDPSAYYYWSGAVVKERALGGKAEVYSCDRSLVDDTPESVSRYDLYKREDTMRIWRAESEG